MYAILYALKRHVAIWRTRIYLSQYAYIITIRHTNQISRIENANLGRRCTDIRGYNICVHYISAYNTVNRFSGSLYIS